MKARWKNMTTQDRIINVLIIILSVAVIVLAALQLLGIWENSINVYEPLLGVILLQQAFPRWLLSTGKRPRSRASSAPWWAASQSAPSGKHWVPPSAWVLPCPVRWFA